MYINKRKTLQEKKSNTKEDKKNLHLKLGCFTAKFTEYCVFFLSFFPDAHMKYVTQSRNIIAKAL